MATTGNRVRYRTVPVVSCFAYRDQRDTGGKHAQREPLMFLDFLAEHEDRAERRGQYLQLIGHLIRGRIEMGQGDEEQIVLNGIQSTGHGQFRCFEWFGVDFVVQLTEKPRNGTI